MQVVPLLALKDNYIFFLHKSSEKLTAVVDPGESKPVLNHLKRENLSLNFILITHHHWDHTDGIQEIKQATGAKVIAFEGDKHRIAAVDIPVHEGSNPAFGNSKIKVLEIPGHTTGHIAYYFEDEKFLFCGDTLFSLGCGRIFEGTFEQMHESLRRLAVLPLETKIFCGHEYTEKNTEFALSIDPQNSELLSFQEKIKDLRKKNQPTLPSTLETELRLNPFLRAKTIEDFKSIRLLRNKF